MSYNLAHKTRSFQISFNIENTRVQALHARMSHSSVCNTTISIYQEGSSHTVVMSTELCVCECVPISSRQLLECVWMYVYTTELIITTLGSHSYVNNEVLWVNNSLVQLHHATFSASSLAVTTYTHAPQTLTQHTHLPHTSSEEHKS